MTTRIPDGTMVYCAQGDFTATIGGWNSVDYLLVNRSDGGPDFLTSRFTVVTNNIPEPMRSIPLLILVVGGYALYKLMR